MNDDFPTGIHPTDPRYLQALDDYANTWGYRAEDVLTPITHFLVVEDRQGSALVVLTLEGVRARDLICERERRAG